MSFTTYSSSWYKLVCNFHNRCEKYGINNSYKKIDELTNYFIHNGVLLDKWSSKEKLHLEEVRGIFDKMFLIGIFTIIFLVVNRKDFYNLNKFSKVNILIICCFFLIIPFFGKFWRDVFHPLIFDNNLWLNNRLDVSFYIMPRKFFKITVGFIFSFCLITNLLIYLYTRKKINNSLNF